MYVDAQERRSIYEAFEVGRATAALMMRITTRQIANLRHGVTSLECYVGGLHSRLHSRPCLVFRR